MTTSVPDFLLELLEAELRGIQERLLQRVAQQYNLNVQELIDKMLPPKPLQVVLDNVQVVKKSAPRREAEVRCQARVWNRGRGGQCTRACKVGDLCTHHFKESEKGGLRHGLISEPPSKEIFGKPKALHITSQLGP